MEGSILDKVNNMKAEKHSPMWLLKEIRNAKSDTHALLKIKEFQDELIRENYDLKKEYNYINECHYDLNKEVEILKNLNT